MFNIPFGELMEKEKADSLVPHFLHLITKRLHQLSGDQYFLCNYSALETEGVFRLSGSSTEIKTLKEQFNEGNYDLSGITSVHVLTGVFKLWYEIPNF
ncbi:MAG: RhoGAP domain-containing protein [Vulcanimicrobiaceae bacterium]